MQQRPFNLRKQFEDCVKKVPTALCNFTTSSTKDNKIKGKKQSASADGKTVPAFYFP
jgi:hypothetical protein